MNGISPGRAAYEASLSAIKGNLDAPPWHWDQLPQVHRDAWEAAADAAVKAHMPEDWTTMLIQRDEARAVVREMCAHWERIGTTREEDELIPQWLERAGLGEVTP